MGFDTDALFARLCSHQPELVVIFSASWVGLALTGGSLLFLNLSGTTEVVALMNVPGLVVMIAWTGYALYRCRDGMPYGRGDPKA